MYLNQACCVKWNSKNSTDFTVSNGVKQGAVISTILFSAYMDILFKQLKHNGIGCHVGPVYALIETRMVRFIFNSINHSNNTCKNILRVKLLSVNSTFAAIIIQVWSN